MKKSTWPAWYSGPDGETEIFDKPEDVPAGWTTGAEKRTVEGEYGPDADEVPAPKKGRKPKDEAEFNL